ncbi:Ig heavy chain Mem5-like precursor [Vicugna pacos]|uniref:Ig heavy chain Mem5-like precursor n=1 Tax=Vicugna pacos TaxID=30538 RepID=A0A6I9GZZ0_VICPA|nr:Ig heavy chain Mem5-like precursor [Vicugna pacos]AHG06395.1 T-cell receptor delta chain [Vicugna pacos]
MQRVCSLIHLTLFWAGIMSADVLVPQEAAVTVSVGGSVTLRCSMKGGSISDYYNYWYKKIPGSTMTFVFQEGGTYGPGFQENFRGEVDQVNNQVLLEILKASERDKGSYYCAAMWLESDYTDWEYPLIFGKGTYLNVEPRKQSVATPSVFVMKNGTKVACLVKDFYPKDININLQSAKKIKEYDPAIVVSPSGRYSAIKLGQYEDSDSVTCSVQHNEQIFNSTDLELKKTVSVTPKPKALENKNPTSKTCYEPRVPAGKVNMMSLSVLGFRMLLAKTVAVNFLLTTKLFFF